jgi:hypothetical protein
LIKVRALRCRLSPQALEGKAYGLQQSHERRLLSGPHLIDSVHSLLRCAVLRARARRDSV